MQPLTSVKHTPFRSFHQAAGARLIEFGGYEMPVRYAGEVREHRCVRERVGLFDVSHMGEFRVSGAGAIPFVDRMVTNDVRALEVGQALYSPMCTPEGGIVDDLLVYRFEEHVMLVVNASNLAKDFAWLEQHVVSEARLEDLSERTALLALQGPKAPDVLRGHVPDSVLELGYYRFAVCPMFGAEVTISRTGYTGEDGFEIYFDPKHAAAVWEGLMRAGAPHGIEPIGLAARDTLRLEMGFMLYGNDIDEQTTPLEAGIGWTIKWAKPDFNGKAALEAQKRAGLNRKLVAFDLEGRRVPRRGMAIEVDGGAVGTVTSGTHSPSLERPIGLGYVELAHAVVGRTLEVVAGSTRLAARVTKLPFYANGSRRTS